MLKDQDVRVIAAVDLNQVIDLLKEVPVKFFEGKMGMVPFLQQLPSLDQFLLQRQAEAQAAKEKATANEETVSKIAKRMIPKTKTPESPQKTQ